MDIKTAFQRPYVWWTITLSMIYFFALIITSSFYVTIRYLWVYSSQIKYGELVFGLVVSLIISILVGMNIVCGVIAYRKRQQIKKQGILSCVGTVSGLAAGICSACVTSIFPFIFGLFGVTFSFANLPFKGAEIQILTVVILILGLYFLSRD